MKVAILQCDEVLEKLQPQFGTYGKMISKMFDEVPESFHFDVFDCREQEYPDDIDLYDFYITTGSRFSVYEEIAWISVLVDFVKELDRQKKKLIGICFGHQIIGMVRRARVEHAGKGYGVGVATNRVLPTPDWIKEKVDQLNIIVSHQDQVTQLPDNVVVIAESDFCPYFVVQWSDHFLSIQGHPEWNKDYSRALMNERRAIIPIERIEEGFASLGEDVDSQLFVRWIVDFIKK